MREVEEIVSESRRAKAIIRRRSDGNLQVDLLRLMEDVDESGNAISFWSEVSGPITIADSLDGARALAAEGLRNLSAG